MDVARGAGKGGRRGRGCGCLIAALIVHGLALVGLVVGVVLEYRFDLMDRGRDCVRSHLSFEDGAGGETGHGQIALDVDLDPVPGVPDLYALTVTTEIESARKGAYQLCVRVPSGYRVLPGGSGGNAQAPSVRLDTDRARIEITAAARGSLVRQDRVFFVAGLRAGEGNVSLELSADGETLCTKTAYRLGRLRGNVILLKDGG